MASVEKRPHDGKVTWVARWRDPAGTQRKRSFVRKTDAERWLTGVDHQMMTGEYLDPAAGRVTVGEWSERWLSGQAHLKPTTAERYAGIVRKHILPTWGPLRIQDVRHADIQTWVSKMATVAEPATVRKTHRVLSLMLDLAVKDSRLARNPAAGVNLPRPSSREHIYLTHGQVAALANAAGTYRLVVLFLAYTGVRWGELAALRIGRVDLLRRRATIAESVTQVNGRFVWGTPKTHERRDVPLPRFLVDDLAAHCAGRDRDDLLFPGERSGGPLRVLVFRRAAFDRAADSIGVPGLHPHDLRHTAASLAISANANVKAVQRMLGHASAAMTLDTYSGLFPDDLDAVAERLDALARDSLVPPVCPEASVSPITQRETGS